MIRNQGGQTFTFPQLLDFDGLPITVGASVSVRVGDESTDGQGELSHVDIGLWDYTPTQDETNHSRVRFILSFQSAAVVVDSEPRIQASIDSVESSQREAGVHELKLFTREDVEVYFPLAHLSDEILDAIEGQQFRLVVETESKKKLLSQVVTIQDSQIHLESSASLTAVSQRLTWSLRHDQSNAYITGGQITVTYAPIKTA